MTEEHRRVIRQALDTEVKAFESDIIRRPLNPLGDIRPHHLSLLREALYEIRVMKVK